MGFGWREMKSERKQLPGDAALGAKKRAEVGFSGGKN